MNNLSCDKQKLEKVIEYYQEKAVCYSRKKIAAEERETREKNYYNELTYIRYILLEGPKELKQRKKKYLKKSFIQAVIVSIILFVFQRSFSIELLEILISTVTASSAIAGINGFNFLKKTKKIRQILKNNTSRIVESNLEIVKEEIAKYSLKKEKYTKMEEELKKAIRDLTDNSTKSNHYQDLSTIEIDCDISKKFAM